MTERGFRVGYKSLRECVHDLDRAGRLVRLTEEVDPDLEIAEIQRRVVRSGGPAVLFERVRGCAFPMLGNLFGTLERAEYIFRDTLPTVRQLMRAAADPNSLLKNPLAHWKLPFHAWRTLPKRVTQGPILARQCSVGELPQLRSWPGDGGAFVTLPLVYTEHAEQPGLMKSNLGMYRVQISGGQYAPNQEVGLHYQIHRGIGVHHTAALRRGVPFRVNILVGGSPAMTVAAVMPLPERMSELTFAGLLAGHRIPMVVADQPLPIYAEADFCISGVVDPDRKLPEGPFGDHLGYYSLAHDFPVLRVERVWHREGAIWPFTVVGRPPQEDTTFGALIHELTGPVIPQVLPGVSAVHAVDEAGVHPLLLAIGSERYTPYQQLERPQELLTQANAILGQGQMSLAKYLLIVNQADDPTLNVHDVSGFLQHVLRRVDWQRDLHFQTCTTIDTLDYSGEQLNAGSKLVIAAVGPARRKLGVEFRGELPEGFREPRVCLPGVLAVSGPKVAASDTDPGLHSFVSSFSAADPINQFPWIVLVDDSEFTARTLANFVWVCFTRSDPARDIDGIEAFTNHKHWGCRGSIVIDARIKPHHASVLEEDPQISRRVDALAARGGPLSKWL